MAGPKAFQLRILLVVSVTNWEWQQRPQCRWQDNETSGDHAARMTSEDEHSNSQVSKCASNVRWGEQ